MDINNKKIVVGITHGDINGINYELFLKTFQDKRIYEFCTPILYGTSKVISYYQKVLDLPKIAYYNIQHVEKARPNILNVFNCIDPSITVNISQPSKEAGEASFQALETAVNDLKRKQLDVLVTAPINKQSMQLNGFLYSGHTVYLTNAFEQKNSLMFLVSENIKVAIATEHIPLKNVHTRLTTELVVEKIRLLHQTLIKDFVKVKGRIAILGLNPHAGDDGLLGEEEEQIINPAIKQARREKILAFGAYSPDGFWGNYRFKKFDAVLALYHDQGLIPFKMLAFDKGVNFTAGLPIIRTSPSHGTAYEIAGQNKASPTSFKNAIYSAIDLYRNRSTYEYNKVNSLDKA